MSTTTKKSSVAKKSTARRSPKSSSARGSGRSTERSGAKSRPLTAREILALPTRQQEAILARAAAAARDDYRNDPELTIFTTALAGDPILEY